MIRSVFFIAYFFFFALETGVFSNVPIRVCAANPLAHLVPNDEKWDDPDRSGAVQRVSLEQKGKADRIDEEADESDLEDDGVVHHGVLEQTVHSEDR